MNLLNIISLVVGAVTILSGGLIFSKAQRLYMKRVGRENGWAYPWDILHYQGKERRLFIVSIITVIAGIFIYFSGHLAAK